jgi:hypothetical protein
MKKINKITIKHIPDYDADLSWIGTFSNEAGEFAIEHKGDRNSCKYFNPQKGACEDIKQARRDYKTIMKYDSGELYCIGIKAEAEIATSEDGNTWNINRVSSAGLWGIEQGYKGDKKDNIQVEDEQIDELHAILEALGFTQKEIKDAEAVKEHADK